MRTLALALVTFLVAGCATAKYGSSTAETKNDIGGNLTYTPLDCPAPLTVAACVERGAK